MVWKINILQSSRIRDLFTNRLTNQFPIDRILLTRVIGRSILKQIQSYIIRNQYRFSKTKNNLGLPSTPHKNYSPLNVSLQNVNYPYVNINLNIKGIERHFRPIVILPKQGKYLTIPTDKESFNKSPRNFNNLFKPKNKNILARPDKSKQNGLKVLYALTTQVYQPRNSTLLPNTYLLLANARREVESFIANPKYYLEQALKEDSRKYV